MTTSLQECWWCKLAIRLCRGAGYGWIEAGGDDQQVQCFIPACPAPEELGAAARCNKLANLILNLLVRRVGGF